MGTSCTKAHSAEELQEWIQRVKADVKKKQQALKEGLLSYQDQLIAEYRSCSNEVLIVSGGRRGGTQKGMWQPLPSALWGRQPKRLLGVPDRGSFRSPKLQRGDAEQRWLRAEQEDLLTVPVRV